MLCLYFPYSWGAESDMERTQSLPSIIIFVSFSMPSQSLEAYIHDANKIHASIVIRGLIDNSMKTTYQRIAELVKSSGGGGIELNPLWFKKFNIQKVPAVVIVNEDKNFDVMVGDIPLEAALREIHDRGEFSRDIAGVALDKLRERKDA